MQERRNCSGLIVANALLALCIATPTWAQEQQDPDATVAVTAAPPKAKEENDGLDPTKPTATATLQFEHLDLRGGFNSDIISANYTQPIGSGRQSVKVEVPISSVDVLGDRSLGLGDISIKYTKIPVVNREYGIVVSGELVLDTADRPELGTGKNVFKPAVIYARFLKNGSIVAPSLVHSLSVWGEDNRSDISITTFDLYYVPRLKNPHLYMTVDPAMNVDWVNNTEYPALAVTVGYRLGKMFGGNGQVFIKPSATFFEDRPIDWGLKVGFQLLNF